jgi:hypothetical protein
MTDRRALVRQAVLLAVVFVATFGLLAGGAALLGRGRAGEPGIGSSPGPSAVAVVPSAGTSASSRPSGSASGSPLASGEVPTIVITGAGDIADCTSNGAQQTSDLLLQQAQGSFFTAGDNAYEVGSPANFRDCYGPTWGRVLDRTILPAPGNHDWVTKDAAGYLGYFGPKAAPDGVTWYSMDLGGWHVVVLDSDCDQVGGCDTSSPQGRWLAHDLETSTATCTLAIWHHPRFSSGEHGDDPQVAPFWDLLQRDGAELVINGHDHDYERFAPQDPSGQEERPGGIREIVAGTGGAGLRQFGRTAPNSEFRIAGEWGVLRLTLEPTRYGWEFLPAGGAEIGDSGSAPCH